MNSTFICQMEQVLDVYEQPFDSAYAFVCFDERPCQLIGDVVAPLPPRPGSDKREDYHYERHGTAVVMMAVEPLSGKRIVDVRKQKTKQDYAEFMAKVEQQYKNAKRITLVQDNLNTHTPSSFYEKFDAPSAFDLTKRFDMVYTLKKASWLNMAEIELSALSKQCLDRRIKDIEVLDREVMTWAEKRNLKKTKITWQFIKTAAREKFEQSYSTLHSQT